MPHFVYTLADPRNNEVVYVGITEDAYQRFKEHLGCFGRNQQKNAWIQRLKDEKIPPCMGILETVETIEEARQREDYWIQHYAACGTLVNLRRPLFAEGWKQRSQQKKTTDPDLLTTVEVADLLGVDCQYVRFLKREKQLLPVAKEGARLWLYRRSDVKAFIDRREAEKESHSRRRIA